MKCNDDGEVGIPFDPVKSTAKIKLSYIPPLTKSKNDGLMTV